jgi:hypothetical protein
MDKINEQCQDKLVRVLRRVIVRTENTPSGRRTFCRPETRLMLVEYVGGAGAEVGGMEVDVEHMVEKDAVVVIGCCWSGSVCWLDAFLGCFQVFLSSIPGEGGFGLCGYICTDHRDRSPGVQADLRCN